MGRLPEVTPRTGRLLIAVLLTVKLLLLVWNAVSFDGKTYDADYHADRALFGGLRAGKTAHDGPLYYLPALLTPNPDDVPRLARATSGEEGEDDTPRAGRAPRVTRDEKQRRDRVLDVLRYTNVVWIGVFYFAWIYVVFPRATPGPRAWFLASLLLLSLPGYQRLAVMSHPENLALSLTSVALAIWLLLAERRRRDEVAEPQGGGLRTVHALLLFGLVTALLASARTFALVPALVLTGAGLLYLARSAVGARLKAVGRSALLVAVVLGLGLAWPLHSRAAREASASSASSAYFPSFDRDRTSFDFVHYYASFEPKALLASSGGVDEHLAGSFFTLVYSETWGDQWLGFATAKGRDTKDWPRRMLLGAALPLPPILLGLAASTFWWLARKARRRASELEGGLLRFSAAWAELEPQLVLLALALLSAAAFVAWQAGPGLLPGDNSTIKFIYFAGAVPPAIALLFAREVEAPVATLLGGYLLGLYLLAFPVAMYWPG